MGRIGLGAVAALLVLGAPHKAEAQLHSLSLELNGSFGIESTSLVTRGLGGSWGVGLRTMYGRYMIHADYETYWPAQSPRAYVMNARIGRLSSRRGGRIQGATIRGKGGYGCVQYVSTVIDRDGDLAERTVTKGCGYYPGTTTIIPSGYVMNTKGWWLGYRHAVDATKTDESTMPPSAVLFTAGAPTLTWARTGEFRSDVGGKTYLGTMLSVEGYLYVVGDEDARFKPGGAVTSYMLLGTFYIGPRLRVDFATGFELVINMGVAYNIASLF